MKKLWTVICLLLIFSILSTAVILILSPDVIPAHYNAKGEVDRFGSKYEQLLFPGFGFLTVGIFLPVLKYQKRNNAPESEQKLLLGTAALSLILFNALGLFFGIAAIRYSSDPVAMDPERILRFTGIATGTLMLLLSNGMPKARRNAFFGLRTKWSMSGDEVWRKSQRFGGISGVICGLVTVILSAFVPGLGSLFLTVSLLLLWIIACVAASYIFWKRETRT